MAHMLIKWNNDQVTDMTGDLSVLRSFAEREKTNMFCAVAWSSYEMGFAVSEGWIDELEEEVPDWLKSNIDQERTETFQDMCEAEPIWK